MDVQVSELIECIYKLREKTGAYTTFSMRLGSGCKYCVYTPILGHKQFDSAAVCLDFITSLINGSEKEYQLKYLTEKREALIESIASLEEQVTDVEYGLKELEGK